MSPTPRTRRLGHSGPVALGVVGLLFTGFGFGAIGAGTAFAQPSHHAAAGVLGASKTKITKHERKESTAVRASETTSIDPASTGPNEPTDSSSTDPSANDEGTTDTPTSDSTDTADQSSIDQSAVVLSSVGQTHHHHRHG
jgi:hypothetical protein